MSKVLVLYYSTYGHVATMARAVAEGARSVPGAQVSVKRVPELMPPEVAAKAGAKPDPDTPLATPEELERYDAIIFGTPTRYGNMAAQMKNFLDQTGALWFADKLVGKLGSVFTSTGSQHGGQESTLLSFHPVLFHLGMVVVGLPYSFKGQMTMGEISGGTPYGATTIAGEGERQSSTNELDGARFQGRHVAELTAALARGREALAVPAGARVSKTTMTIELNHPVVAARDPQASAASLAELLGRRAPVRFGPFHGIELDNGVTLDFLRVDGDIASQHYAFIVGEDEFDRIFGRIRERGLSYWADPGHHQPGQINHGDGGRGMYWEDADGHNLEIITRPYGSSG